MALIIKLLTLQNVWLQALIAKLLWWT